VQDAKRGKGTRGPRFRATLNGGREKGTHGSKKKTGAHLKRSTRDTKYDMREKKKKG